MNSIVAVTELDVCSNQAISTAGTKGVPVIAAFDFDKTITTKHTFWRLLWRAVGSWRFLVGVVRLSPAILRFFLKHISLLELRELTIHYYLSGFPADRFRVICDDFAHKTIPRWIRPAAAERILWHRLRGDIVIIVSNAPEDYLIPWAESVGITNVLGSRFEIQAGHLTGKLDGNHCFGEEKVSRLRELIGDLDQYEIHAYGDSAGDIPMLKVANYGYYRTFSVDMFPPP